MLLSTHIVSDIEYIANNIMLMKMENIFYAGTAEDLVSSMKEKIWQYKNNKNQTEGIISIEKPTEDAVAVEKNLEDAFLFYFWRKNRRKNKMLKLGIKTNFSKKINVFAIGLALILAVIFSGFAVTNNRYVDENGNASTGIMATKLTDNRRGMKGH